MCNQWEDFLCARVCRKTRYFKETLACLALWNIISTGMNRKYGKNWLSDWYLSDKVNFLHISYPYQ